MIICFRNSGFRYGVSARSTAAITTAAWIDGGLITKEDTKLIVDHNKVICAQQKVMNELEEDFNKMAVSGEISCILFDGRIDMTKVMLEAEKTDRLYPGAIKEEHYSVCMMPGGKFLFHFTPEKASKEKKHAEIIGDHIVDWMVPRSVDKYLGALGGDSTNVNTGWEGGAIHHMECKIGRKVNWLICLLNTNKLALRHLIIGLDGPTLSDNKWSSDIGKMLDVTGFEVNPKFQTITVGTAPIYLSEEIVKDLSTDQSYAYRIVTAI